MSRTLSNADLAELLARKAEASSGILVRAFRRAARSAFLWPELAHDVLRAGRPLSELHGVGPFIARQLQAWIEKPPREEAKPPLIRRDFLTSADARVILAKDREWSKRLRGDLQMHTGWSDGSASIGEMAEGAKERRYEYIGITDHSKGLKIAGGIDEKALAEQAREIAGVNRRNAGSGLTVLRSVEMNLNPRGEGDMDPRSLARLDIVLGAFHSALRTKEDQTPRYLAALRNPDIQILGHPRGRIYNFRMGLKADWARVFAQAAKCDRAVEIDSYPDRQDLNVALLKIARKEGVRISLGTDAHHPHQLEFIELGLAAALKAKIQPDRVINFMDLTSLRAWVAKLRRRRR
ncbi:MAG TPA: PHP domain-containing protein [Chthoniobacterales bacterium]|nr:PHP domain-containing protein [Chthoniobacterales bacterium]